MVFLGRLICLLPLAALVGCATDYHCYSCGQVRCSYCPPNPIPYSVSEPRNCKDSIGQTYLATPRAGVALADSVQNSPDHDYYSVGPGK